MLHISYYITQAEQDKLKTAALTQIDAASLHYYLLQSTITLQCEKRPKAALFFDAPVYDFATCLLNITRALETSSMEVFEFTESEDIISFSKKDDDVQIATNLSNWSCVCSSSELLTVSKRLVTQVLNDISRLVPEMMRNDEIQKTYSLLRL